MFHSVFCWAQLHSSVCDQNVWIFILRVVWCYGRGTITMLPFTSAGPDPYLLSTSTEDLSVCYYQKIFYCKLVVFSCLLGGMEAVKYKKLHIVLSQSWSNSLWSRLLFIFKDKFKFLQTYSKTLSMEKIRIHPSMHS